MVLLLAISMLMVSSNSNKGLTFFEEAGECISENSFEVFQVLDSGDALARECKGILNTATGMVVLFVTQDGKSYYDDQIIKVPSGKCVKQIGIYKYLTESGFEKTVPVVDIR